jgi:hypothetical protein
MKRSALLALAALISMGCSNAVDDIVDNHDLSGNADMAMGPIDMTYQDFGPCGVPNKGANEKGGVCMKSVTGMLVDENGAGIGNSTLISVCAGTCWNGKTGMAATDGTFAVPINHDIVLDNYALEVHGRPNRASYYLHLPPPNGDTINFPDPIYDPPLPTSGPMIAMDKSAQTVTSGDVTMVMPAGTDVTFDVEDVGIPNNVGYELRAVTIPDPTKLQFIDPNKVPLALFTMEPFEVGFSQKVQFNFANTAGLAANAKVEVWAMKSLLFEAPPAGALEKVALATVSSDGKMINMNPGEGVTWTTWFAIFPGQ